MVWKTVPAGDVGNSSQFGGNDQNKLMQQLSGTDNDSVKLPVDYIDLDDQSTDPTSPPSGYLRLFCSSDGRLKIKRSNGDVVIVD